MVEIYRSLNQYCNKKCEKTKEKKILLADTRKMSLSQ